MGWMTGFMCTDGGCGGLLVLLAAAVLVLTLGWVLVFAAPIWRWGERALPARLGGSRRRRLATALAVSVVAAFPTALLVAQDRGLWPLVPLSAWVALPLLARRQRPPL